MVCVWGGYVWCVCGGGTCGVCVGIHEVCVCVCVVTQM